MDSIDDFIDKLNDSIKINIDENGNEEIVWNIHKFPSRTYKIFKMSDNTRWAIYRNQKIFKIIKLKNEDKLYGRILEKMEDN